MIVLIDNYDSFSYNLVQALLNNKVDVRVFRNDEVSVSEVAELKPDGIVISPGPGGPLDAGVSVELIRSLSGKIPILGVCLGHQCVGFAFGAKIANAKRIMHGKTSMVTHRNTPLYNGVKNPFPAGRYHSIAIVRNSLPPELTIDSESDDGEIMGIIHKEHPTFGVQFHPESVLTPSGPRIIKNFLNILSR